MVAFLSFVAAYILGIYQSYQANGVFWAFVVAVPALGQLLWFGVMWQAVGLVNSFSVLLGVAMLAVLGVRAFGNAES